MKSIIIFIDYFGSWPSWFDMFLESCRMNPTIRWCIHTDCPPPENGPANVQFLYLSFSDYCSDVSHALGVDFVPKHPYNLCNLKPTFGFLYRDIHQGYDYYGWGDLDVIYGDIRSIYLPHVLEATVISSHEYICSGHLTLVKNEPWLHEAFRRLTGWKARLESPERFEWHESLAEAKLTALFCPIEGTRKEFSSRYAIEVPDSKFHENNYFREQWSTPFTPTPWTDGSLFHPELWYWSDGVLTNNIDRNRKFLYLHLMNFKSKCWVNERIYGNAFTWKSLSKCMHFEINELRARDFGSRNVRIDRLGLHLL